MTHEYYVKRRDEIILKAMGAFASHEEYAVLTVHKRDDIDVRAAQQAIDQLFLDMVGDSEALPYEKTVRESIKRAIKGDNQ